MLHYLYDGSFEGLFSVIFDIYCRKEDPASITSSGKPQLSLFNTYIKVPSNVEHAERVIRALAKKNGEETCQKLYRVYLSELPESEMLIFMFAKKSFSSDIDISRNYADEHVLKVRQICQKVSHEAHRMLGFVRYRKIKGDIYLATIEPDHDILPLIGNHFRKRYADQKWVIYDNKRKYGLFYNLKEVSTITFEGLSTDLDKLPSDILEETQDDFERLWKLYFNSVNIAERKNLKLHLQFLPMRYWKFLPEKNA